MTIVRFCQKEGIRLWVDGLNHPLFILNNKQKTMTNKTKEQWKYIYHDLRGYEIYKNDVYIFTIETRVESKLKRELSEFICNCLNKSIGYKF